MSTNDQQDVDLNNDEIDEIKNDEFEPEEANQDINKNDDDSKEGDDKPKEVEAPEARKARLERQLDQHKKKHPELYQADTTKTKDVKKSNSDLDYGQKAYLAANGIKGAKEFDFVKNELKASGQDLDTLLENDYFISRLDKFRALNKTSDAVPNGKRTGGAPTDSVEYWLDKPIEEVPHEMRTKVVNARLEKDKVKGVFYNSPTSKK